MFLRQHWIFLTVLVIAICGVSLYVLRTDTPKAPIVIIKPVEPVEKPTETEAPERETSQGGHRHADGTWHDEPHEVPALEEPSEESESLEFKAASEKRIADLAAAKTARERNEAIIRRMEENPLFEDMYHLFEDMYNFYKEHPDFDHQTASPELDAKWQAAVRAQHAKMRAEAEQTETQYVQRVEVDMRPFIPNQGGNP